MCGQVITQTLIFFTYINQHCNILPVLVQISKIKSSTTSDQQLLSYYMMTKSLQKSSSDKALKVLFIGPVPEWQL
jgi:hypothetical protein